MIPLYLLSIPNTLIGLILLLFYGADWGSLGRRAGALEVTVKRAIGNPGAQTWGFLICYVGEQNRARSSAGLGVHERKHVRDALIMLGIPFLLIYGGEFAVRFCFAPGDVGGRDTPEYWTARGHRLEYAEALAARRSARWFRCYWNLWLERRARAEAASL